ncbi:hypothetical protein [Enterobacter hormaechei]|uniref:hypothetical protein n=1 Tax=Enterobacter hormaechei TaxID=158836 RepID=UPI0016531473|nr:hypothetical protein [Enterobacter hormaechei]
MWFKKKQEVPVKVPETIKRVKEPLMRNNPMKRSIQSTLSLGNNSPIISFGFSGGNQCNYQ